MNDSQHNKAPALPDTPDSLHYKHLAFAMGTTLSTSLAAWTIGVLAFLFGASTTAMCVLAAINFALTLPVIWVLFAGLEGWAPDEDLTLPRHKQYISMFRVAFGVGLIGAALFIILIAIVLLHIHRRTLQNVWNTLQSSIPTQRHVTP